MDRFSTNFDSEVLYGAYGLRLAGVDGAEAALVRAQAGWPLVRVSVKVSADPAGAERLDESRARVRLRTGGYVDIRRHPGSAVFTVRKPLTAEELVHPYLAPVAAVTAHWHGRESFHAGAVAIGDSAWAIVGDRDTGKSSLLAALAQRGVDIVCDDVLVVAGREAFAGPRTVDLREDAAAALGTGVDIGVAGTRERWRLRLAPLDRRLNLAGWLFTAWKDETCLVRLPASATLRRLLEHRVITAPPHDPATFLLLSTLPAWELRRPRRWEALPAALESLLGTLTS